MFFHLQKEHRDLLNSCSSNASTALGTAPPESVPRQNQALPAAADAPPASAHSSQLSAEDSSRPSGLALIQRKIELLQARRSRSGSGLPGEMHLQELSEHAQSPQEQLLVAKLMQATTIMQDQEQVCRKGPCYAVGRDTVCHGFQSSHVLLKTGNELMGLKRIVSAQIPQLSEAWRHRDARIMCVPLQIPGDPRVWMSDGGLPSAVLPR